MIIFVGVKKSIKVGNVLDPKQCWGQKGILGRQSLGDAGLPYMGGIQ